MRGGHVKAPTRHVPHQPRPPGTGACHLRGRALSAGALPPLIRRADGPAREPGRRSPRADRLHQHGIRRRPARRQVAYTSMAKATASTELRGSLTRRRRAVRPRYPWLRRPAERSAQIARPPQLDRLTCAARLMEDKHVRHPIAAPLATDSYAVTAFTAYVVAYVATSSASAVQPPKVASHRIPRQERREDEKIENSP